MAITAAVRAAHALEGGKTALPQEDGPEAAAIWGVCEQVLEGNLGGIGTRQFTVLSNGNVSVGYKAIPNRTYPRLLSVWHRDTGLWVGLRWFS